MATIDHASPLPNSDGPLATNLVPQTNGKLEKSSDPILESQEPLAKEISPQANGKQEKSNHVPEINGNHEKSTTGVTRSHDSDKDVLHITDSRTGMSYEIPITHNSVRALDFKAVKVPHGSGNPADDAEGGLRLLDPGFQNTAVKESKITFV